MNVSLVIDMNLSVEWVSTLKKAGWDAVHWSEIGDSWADDAEIMEWALNNRHVVFTHDLDFGAILALTKAKGPSVLQVRGQKVLPEDMAPLVIAGLQKFNAELSEGALVVINQNKSRARILPI